MVTKKNVKPKKPAKAASSQKPAKRTPAKAAAAKAASAKSAPLKKAKPEKAKPAAKPKAAAKPSREACRQAGQGGREAGKAATKSKPKAATAKPAAKKTAPKPAAKAPAAKPAPKPKSTSKADARKAAADAAAPKAAENKVVTSKQKKEPAKTKAEAAPVKSAPVKKIDAKAAAKKGKPDPAEPQTAREDADSPLLDMSDVGVRKMIQRAKQRGYVTYDELNKVLPSDKVSSEQIEDTMSMLSEMGINVIESEEQEEAGEGEVPATTEGKEVATTAKASEQYDRTDDPVRMYLREMGSVELLSREGEIAIAKRIEAGRELMIGALCESPLTFEALTVWRDELNEGKVLLRDIIDLEAMYGAGPDGQNNANVANNANMANGASAKRCRRGQWRQRRRAGQWGAGVQRPVADRAQEAGGAETAGRHDGERRTGGSGRGGGLCRFRRG